MRNIKTLLCVIGLVCTTHGGGTLLAATTQQVIVLGEVVYGTPLADGILGFELTAASDGWVAVRLDWDPWQGGVILSYFDDFGFDGAYIGVSGTLEEIFWMATGHTYSFWVATHVPFILSTHESGPPPPPSPPPPPPPPQPPAPQPPQPPSGCATPDPFTALGGGTCLNGGWLPRGMVPPGVNPNSPPAPAPPPPASGGCTMPDPFVALGGGTCSDGGWWPPGLTPPGVNPNPPPPSPPPSSPGGCTTPDPFVSLGGGTCSNGGWWPPGLLPPILSILIR